MNWPTHIITVYGTPIRITSLLPNVFLFHFAHGFQTLSWKFYKFFAVRATSKMEFALYKHCTQGFGLCSRFLWQKYFMAGTGNVCSVKWKVSLVEYKVQYSKFNSKQYMVYSIHCAAGMYDITRSVNDIVLYRPF